MNLKKSLLFAVAIPLLLALSACSGAPKQASGAGGTQAPASAGEKQADQAKSYVNDSVELVIFGNPGDLEEVWNDRLGDALKQKFPNYKFTYIPKNKTNNLNNMIAAGAQLDLIYDSVSGAVNSIMKTDLKFDMSELVKKHQIDISRFEPATIDVVKQFGGLYGFPIHSGGLVLYYNKDLFDKFGVGYPHDGMTWDEAIELGKKMTRNDNGNPYIGLATSVSHALSMNSYSLPFVDKTTGKAAINNDNYRKLVQTLAISPSLASGYKEQVAALKRTFNSNDFMDNQNIAMFVMNFGLQDKINKFNWDMVSLPVFKELPGVGTQPYPNVLFMTNVGEHKDQAMEVLKYLTSDDFQMVLSKRGYIPVLKNENIKKAFMQDSSFHDKNMANAVFTNRLASPINRSEYEPQVTKPLLDNITKVITGNMDLNTALRSAEEEANKAIEEAQSK